MKIAGWFSLYLLGVMIVVTACGALYEHDKNQRNEIARLTRIGHDRGYIRCVDGHLEVGNIDISNLNLVDKPPLGGLTDDYCR